MGIWKQSWERGGGQLDPLCPLNVVRQAEGGEWVCRACQDLSGSLRELVPSPALARPTVPGIQYVC